MDNQQTWVEALNINPEMLNEWSSAAPAGKPLLVWCLEQGHVSLPEYLQWASEAFGVPVLSSAFFEQGGLDRAYFESVRRADNWSPWFFPVNEWDGVTHVACVEVPAEEDRSAGICYVLADPRAMAEAWEITGTGRAPVATPSVPPLPTPPPLDDAPMGMNLKAKPFKLNLDETGLMIGHDQEPAPPAEVKRSLPPQEETSLTRIGSAQTTVGEIKPPILQLDDGLTGMTLLKPRETEAPPKPAAPPIELKKPTAPPVPTPTPPPSMDLSTSEMAIDDISPPTAIHRMPVSGAALNLPTNEDVALHTVYEALGKTYGHTCVIRFSADGMARLYKWSPSMKPPGNGDKAVLNLSYPSFLRIVSKTLLPYHGYLVDSPTHKDFFEGMGLDHIPACVTAVPIKVNGVLWGVVLSLGSEVLQGMENLAVVVSATDQLVTALAPVWAKAS